MPGSVKRVFRLRESGLDLAGRSTVFPGSAARIQDSRSGTGMFKNLLRLLRRIDYRTLARTGILICCLIAAMVSYSAWPVYFWSRVRP